MSDFETERDVRINQLLEEARSELRAGGILETAVWQARYPDLGDDLGELLETLRQLDTAVEDWKLLSSTTQTLPYSLVEKGETSGERPGGHIGRYLLQEEIGAGGMGTVFKARDPQLERVVAVKVPRFEGSERDRAQAGQRFLREARAAAQVRHAHVCPIHDVGEHEGCPYVVMAYVEGHSLADRLREGPPFHDPREAVALVRQVAEALAAVHGHDIVHRDLKPGNILLDKRGQALLADFGLACPADAEPMTVEGTVLGTPAYMAPEQAEGDAARIGPRSDLYSLGVVLFHLLTGRLPFEGPPLVVIAKVRSDPPPPLSRFRPDLDPALEQIVQKAMARRPEDRFANAQEFANTLNGWLAGRSTAVDVPSPLPPAQDEGRKPGPTVVRVDVPGGSPVTVSVDPGAAASGQMAVTVKDRPATKKRRRSMTITVTLTFSLFFAFCLYQVLQLGEKEVSDNGYAKLNDKKPKIEPSNKDKIDPNKKVKDPFKLDRVRTPRMSIAFAVETSGAMANVELPLVIGVLADLSGQPKPPLPPLKKRRMVVIDRDNFNDVMERAAPRLSLKVPNKLGGSEPLAVELTFKTIEDFEPLSLMKTVPELSKWVAQREALIKNKEDQDKIHEIERRLWSQLRAILHEADFQRLEASWRGLHYLTHQAETGHHLMIRVLNVGKHELLKDLEESPFEQSALYKKLYEDEFCQLGGQPYGLLVSDFLVSPDGADIRLLQKIARVGAKAHVPFVAGAAPRAEVEKSIAWQAFRATDEARFVGLTLPRVPARLPYPAAERRSGVFPVGETDTGSNADQQLWMSSAWAFAAAAADAQARYSWLPCIWDSARIDGLPALPGRDPKQKRFTELSFPEGTPARLSSLGFLPLVGSDYPRFFGAQSCQLPRTLPDPEATARAAATARLDVLLSMAPFVHCLQVQARDKLGSSMEPKDVERHLNQWLDQFVLADPAKASVAMKVRRPLLQAHLKIRPAAAKGDFEMVICLRPHYRLDPVPSVPVCTVAAIPKRP